ncbi:hypothetical protein [Terrarubrum flagellatum]|uniref:hypothetical protein n=1 Tax=Terrirubrum flagellatum TaxID=2895980 RepID=UPI0031455381
MKIAISIITLTALSSVAQAQYYGNRNSGYGGYGTGSNSNSHSVQPHYNSNGAYVDSYRATNPNNTTLDNYSTRGNYNPYTGQTGHRSPY